MKKVLNILIYLILGIIIAFSLFSIISIKVMGNKYLNIFGYTYFEVQTGSMDPTIKIDDLIIVKIDEEYKVGDIITFEDEGAFVTHRIVEINGNEYITKGDFNNTNDKPINKSSIVGSVVKIISGLGIITKILQNPITLIIVFVIGLLVITYSSFDNKKKE